MDIFRKVPESRKGRRPRRQFDEESPHAVRDRQLRVLIRASHEGNRRAYGSPRVLKDLLEQGIPISRKRVVRPMQAEGLKARVRKRFHSTTMALPCMPPIDALLY